MMLEPAERLLDAASASVGQQTGLRVEPERWPALRRAMQGYETSGEAWGDEPWSRAQVELVARQIAVGETYFFRDPAAFAQIEGELLPPLVVARRATTRRLRLWSVGCCTGEEAYSLAIVLCRLIPDIERWDIEILGTDIQPDFLAHANAGVYIDWSFRSTDAWRDVWFDPVDAEHWAVRPELKRLVCFRHLNLAHELNAGTGVDLILCRHVLMYFEPDQARRALVRLHAALTEGGRLLVGTAENHLVRHAGLAPQRLGDVVFHRRTPATAAAIAPAALMTFPPSPKAEPSSPCAIAPMCDSGSTLAQAIADCESAIAADRCDPMLHYRHAMLLEQAGGLAAARDALRRSLFLDPRFAAAHEALGRLCERQGRHQQAARHFMHACALARPVP